MSLELTPVAKEFSFNSLVRAFEVRLGRNVDWNVVVD